MVSHSYAKTYYIKYDIFATGFNPSKGTRSFTLFRMTAGEGFRIKNTQVHTKVLSIMGRHDERHVQDIAIRASNLILFILSNFFVYFVFAALR